MKKNEEKPLVKQEKNSDLKSELTRGLTVAKNNQILPDKDENVIEKILEAVRNKTCHAC